jgi:hypothetical protein
MVIVEATTASKARLMIPSGWAVMEFKSAAR